MEEDNILVEWEAYEYREKKKKPDWFWALGIIAIAGSAAAFIYANFLFGVFILFAAASLMFFGTTKPKRMLYIISTEGLLFDNRLYPFKRLKSFWMEERANGEKRLLIKSDRTVVPIFVLPFEEDETGEEIYAILSQILEEEEIQESHAHKIMDVLGF